MNTRVQKVSAAITGVLLSGSVALPVFAQDIPDVENMMGGSGIPVPSVPQGQVPTLPPIGPAGFPIGASGLGGIVPNMQRTIRGVLPQRMNPMEDGVEDGDAQGDDGNEGDVQVGDVRVGRQGVRMGDMRVGPDGVRVPSVVISSSTIRAAGVRVGPDGVRVPGVKISSTSVDVGGVRVGPDGVRLPGMMPLMGMASTTRFAVPNFGRTSDLVAGFVGDLQKNGQDRMENVKERAGGEIDKRIDALNDLKERIMQMVHLSEADKNVLLQEIDNQIGSLMSLKDTISSNVSTSTLKTSVSSITSSFRTFALVIPKEAIVSAAARIDSLVGDMNTVGTKLKTLIDSATVSGVDVSAAQSAYDDFATQLGNAQAAANDARTEVANLQPDNGDSSVYQANIAALKDAQQKIKQAQQYLKQARADITSIRKALEQGANAAAPADDTTN